MSNLGPRCSLIVSKALLKVLQVSQVSSDSSLQLSLGETRTGAIILIVRHVAKCKYDTVKCVIQYFDAASFMSFKFVADYSYYQHDIINKFYYAWNYFVMCHKDLYKKHSVVSHMTYFRNPTSRTTVEGYFGRLRFLEQIPDN
eukprot:65842_1